MPGTDATVAGRHVFFNHSAFDGNDPAANAADDAAVSPAVAALLPGQSPSLANVSSYVRGLNGLMVDVDHLQTGATLSADDFIFRTGNDVSDPNGWSPAPTPSINVRRGAGVNGSDRVTLTWPDGAVHNAWLQVTVLDTLETGLSTPDVFYFGSLPGDAGIAGATPIDITDPGGPFSVTSRDLLATRRGAARRGRVDVSSPLDHDHNGRVNARDVLVVRQNLLSRLERVQPPASHPTYYVSPEGDDAVDGRSPLSAWRTVAKVNSTTFPPGAHVLFQRGGEWHEQLVVPSSGTTGAPVVFASYGSGLKPKFWGSDPLDPANFQPVDGADSTFRILPSAGITVNSIQADHSFFRSAYLVANRTADPSVALAALEAVPGTWYQDPRSGAVYVHTTGDDPRSGSVLYTASTRENVVYVHLQHDVVIRNLVVDEAAIYNSGYAFAAGESANVTIEGCEAYRAAKHHFGAVDTDNFVGRSLYSAWAMPDQGYGGSSAYVSYSDWQRPDSRSAWYDCVYDELDSAVSPYLAFITHGPGLGEVLVQNMVSRGGLGISVSLDGPDSRIRFQGGVIENGYLAIRGSNSVVDGMTLRGPKAVVALTGLNNVVQNVLIDGAKPDVGDLGALVDHGQDNTFRFNTVRLDPATAIGVGVVVDARLVGSGGARTRVYGNIIDAARAFRVDTERAWPITSDHNLFARTPFFMNPNGDAMELAQWRATRGQDANSIVGDPLFADAALGDFSLLPGSPAIDAFTPTELLTGIPTDSLGLPRPQGAAYDLGAFERPAAPTR